MIRPAVAAEWRDGVTGRQYLVLEMWEAAVLILAVLVGLWWVLRSASLQPVKQEMHPDP